MTQSGIMFVLLSLCISVTVDAQCNAVLTAVPGYSLQGDSATFLVTPLAQVLARPSMPIDEDDRVIVYVLTTKQRAPSLRVRRISAFRTPGTINVVGLEEQMAPKPRPQGPPDTACVLRVELADFAPGHGEVVVERVEEGSSLKVTSLGQFDFGVNPLYIGALSFGPVRSTLVNPSFAIVKKGSDSVITQTNVGDTRVLYVVMYTPFIWGKRDTDKPAKKLWHRVNPIIGMTLKEITDNALVGVTVDFPFGVFFSYGWHFSKVSELDSSSGAVLGQSFAGPSAPTRTRWKTGTFAGLTIDLRVALKLIKAATTTTLQ